ncbi:MAG: acetyl-CoA carboxylase biotin carboxyl carrier protein subunit [Myxococcales bacterium]|nr:acetyl-CoA carboxylase biotin carboxyl carrier protein subunit [Myxococcales bacterium]
MPATVLRVEVTVGDVVRAGQALLVLGAMKTEIVLRAPVPSAVRAIHTRVGSAVVPGERLVDLDPLDPKA